MRKIFFGWRTVLATFIIDIWGTSKNYAFSTYTLPLIEEFGWTRAEVSIANSLGSVEGGIEGPFGGIATDKYGPRAVCLAGILIASLGFFLMYFINNLWSFTIIWGLIVSTGFNLGFMQPLSAAIAKWFVKKRGLAMGISRMGTAIGGSTVPVFMTWLLYSVGWRTAFFLAGLITLTIGVPLIWFCVRSHPPEYYGLLPDGEEIENGKEKDDANLVAKAGREYAERIGEHEFTPKEAIRTWQFWAITVGSTLRSLTTTIIQVHLVLYLTDIGFSPMAAAAALGLMTAASAPLRVIVGWIADKTSTNRMRYILAISYIGEFLGMFLVTFSSLFPWSIAATIHLGLIIRGFGLGGRNGSLEPLMGRYFGRKNYSTINGIASVVGFPQRVIGPVYAGWVFDVTGSYTTVFQTIVVFLFTAIVMTSFCKPPKPPATKRLKSNELVYGQSKDP